MRERHASGSRAVGQNLGQDDEKPREPEACRMSRPILQFNYILPRGDTQVQVYARSYAEAVRTLCEAGHFTTVYDFRRFAGSGKAPFDANGNLVILSASITEEEAMAAFPARRPEKNGQPGKPPARKAVTH